MTREEVEELTGLAASMGLYDDKKPCKRAVILGKAIKALEQEPCEDAISRQAVLDAIDAKAWEFCNYLISKGRNDEQKPVSLFADNLRECIREDLPPVTPQQKTGYCRDCKWWKDSDGAYRRGIDAKSKCPMNRIEVYEGNGYCFMFEPQESEK